MPEDGAEVQKPAIEVARERSLVRAEFEKVQAGIAVELQIPIADFRKASSEAKARAVVNNTKNIPPDILKMAADLHVEYVRKENPDELGGEMYLLDIDSVGKRPAHVRALCLAFLDAKEPKGVPSEVRS